MWVDFIRTISPLLLLFMTQDCVETVFVQLNILHAPCIKLIVSKTLGYAIVGGSMLVKFPQILKIHNANSVEGLSLATFMLETVCAMVTVTYNHVSGFPFSTWGESFFILIQLVILLSQFFFFSGNMVMMLLTPILVPLISYLLTTVPLPHLALCLSAAIPLLALSKVLQIRSTFSLGHTGQLSFVTSLMNFLGTIARLFTVIQEVEDQLLLINASSVFVLNSIIILQFAIYWNAKKEKAQ